jgi:iron complex outermembrane receptor protein
VQSYAGSFQSIGAQGMLRMQTGNVQHLVAFAQDQSAGHWYNSDFRNRQLFYTAAHSWMRSRKHFMNYMAGYSDRNFGANGFYTNAFPDQWEHTKMAFLGLNHNTVFGDVIFSQRVLYRQHQDEFRLKRNDPAFYTNTHVSDVMSYEANARRSFGNTEVLIGVEERLEKLQSTNLGQRSRDYQSIYMQAVGELATLNYSAGLLLFSYQWQNPQLMPSAQLGKSWKRNNVFLNYSRGNRVPSWTEMYYSDPSNVGNPNLLPEYSNATELGWRQQPKISKLPTYQLNLEAAAFYRKHSNMIDWVRDASSINPNPNPWMPVNIASIQFKGIEASVKLTNAAVKWGLRQFQCNYTFIAAQHAFDAALESRYAISSLRHQLNAGLALQFSYFAQLQVNYRFIQRVSMPAYHLLDAKLRLNVFRNFSLFVEGNNLTNTAYVEAGYVQMPGRWYKLGLQFQKKASENPKL